MDLSHLYASQPSNKTDALPIRLVAPVPNVIPQDEVVQYVTVEKLNDVLTADQGKVLLFDEHTLDLLECLVEYPAVFGFNCMVLSGLPAADYSSPFESKTYALERVAFASLVNDLIERKRVAAALIDERETEYAKEKAKYTRKSGHVKELTGVRVAGGSDVDDQTAEVD